MPMDKKKGEEGCMKGAKRDGFYRKKVEGGKDSEGKDGGGGEGQTGVSHTQSKAKSFLVYQIIGL
ncbi:hypothetical protein HPP92_028063 [Vanilla planifolia]|uniref:Uncharacterized protein n=1 Tax=Vanilla planifolia TaxID=51239 RepID=A0A835P8R8_VANPL|nr:hypothetical protein HPP92_028063 [Vanilla planifolia]